MRRSVSLRRAAGAASLLLAACLLPQSAAAAVSAGGGADTATAHSTGGTPPSARALADRLAKDVTDRDVHRHLRALQHIADISGGNRGHDRIGFTRSVRYVSGLLKAAGYRVSEQTVPYTDFDVTEERLTVSGAGKGSGRVKALMTRYTPSTSARGIDAPLAALPSGRTGCTAADYKGVGAAGSAVVLARAACGYATQQKAAAAAGARAVLLYYPTPSPDNVYRLLGFDPADYTIPIASVPQRDGERLARAAAGGHARAHLTLRADTVRRTTVNLVADTAGGDREHTVLLGSHLDSVTEGPGINDNGSSAATVLQTALELAPRQHAVKNRVRFVWWGAEELADVGSEHYVGQLSAAQRRQTAAVLNAELIASPNDGRFVWDPGSGGSHVIAGLFAGYFAARGLPYERTSPDSIGSDHLPFQAAGIPVGGLDGGSMGVKTPAQQAKFGGRAGQMFDPCYHQPCDDLGTVNRRALDANAPALAWVTGRLAMYNGDVRAARTARPEQPGTTP